MLQGKRRALLVGLEHYGKGFDSLPAVNHDLSIMRHALEHCGYEIEPNSGTPDADELTNLLHEFCEECGEHDTHVIYFSGHGISVGGQDFIVPSGVSLEEAETSEYKRVSTNLKVADGLVVFVVDACRDSSVTEKGGDSFGYEIPDGPQLIRFFGCSKGQRCQVIDDPEYGCKVSMFTKALSDSLIEGKSDCLRTVLKRTESRCKELAENPNIPRTQIPHLSYGGESTDETLETLQRRIFNPLVTNPIWKSFDPTKMHCLLLTSEGETSKSLQEMMELTLDGEFGNKVWESFRSYANGKELLERGRRKLERELHSESIHLATINITQALERRIFDDVVRALAEADLVVFDVTKFEPGIMLLMGIRSVCRRGVSIATAGQGWREKKDIHVPFNLADVSLGSHTENEGGAGDQTTGVEERFVGRIQNGFKQMKNQPAYQDLPAYHALRRLGPLYDASSSIPLNDYILVLTTYHTGYDGTWKKLKNSLQGKFNSYEATKGTKVWRLIDLGNPQLVSQSLYEQIRRTEGCLVDWTEFSSSTFFELGVRLAVSEWGAVQLIDRRYLPGGEKAKLWEDMSRQIERMIELFNPRVYEVNSFREIENAVEELAKRDPGSDTDAFESYARVAFIVSNAMNRVQECPEPVFELLKDTADSLHHPLQSKKGAPQTLFRQSRKQLVKRASEGAAAEMRIAAWLYLHHRKSDELDKNKTLREVYKKLANDSASTLLDGESEDFKLGMYIQEETHKKMLKIKKEAQE